MIRDFTPRLYQQTILGTAANKNTLVVLPTGLGKTALAFLLAAQRFHQYPNSKILILAPTKPLCEQHITTFKKHLTIPEEKIVLFTGSVAPKKRGEMWKEAQLIVSTPQGLENDCINRRVKLEDVSLLVIDEAHHATGDYAYVWIAQQYDKVSPRTRILALTASPGSDLEKIREICNNLKIEKVEVRTEKDPDVKPYVQNVKTNWLKVDFPDELKKIQKHLQDSRKSKLIEAQNYGYCTSSSLIKTELLRLQGELQKKISSGERDFEILKSVSLTAEALKIDHALELLESQGIKPLQTYFKKIQSEALTSKTKAVKNLMMDQYFKSAMYLTEELADKHFQHPKLVKLKEIVDEQITKDNDAKIIIFTQFRDSGEQIVKQLEKLKIKTHIFVGQAKKNGLGFSQKQQKEILDKFRIGEFNVLVATSVAEEGLDIPKVDKVIFYEPIPSAIRSIQRRGRTGRLEEGAVTILVTSGTRDEAYRWSSFHKEKRMYRNLDKLKKEFSLSSLEEREDRQNGQNKEDNEDQQKTTLHQYISDDKVVAVLADHREKDNRVVKDLIDLGVSVKTGQLEVADYLVSGKVAVELKKVPDFVASIIDGRLLDQVRGLKNNFEKAILIIEGEEDIYSVRKVHANAIRGMLASIVLDFGIPILYTKSPNDTASLLAVMAKREQDKGGEFSYHPSKPRTMREQQEFIVSSFPNIGVLNARKLLERFGSLKNLVNTSKIELMEIDKIGDKIADRLLEMFEGKYEKKD
jgi:ERCC4-related helicase